MPRARIFRRARRSRCSRGSRSSGDGGPDATALRGHARGRGVTVRAAARGARRSRPRAARLGSRRAVRPRRRPRLALTCRPPPPRRRRVLNTPSPHDKAALTREIVALWDSGTIARAYDPEAPSEEPPERPARCDPLPPSFLPPSSLIDVFTSGVSSSPARTSPPH